MSFNLRFQNANWFIEAPKYYVGVTFSSHVIVITVGQYSYVFYYLSIDPNLKMDCDHQNNNLERVIIIQRKIWPSKNNPKD